MNDRGSSTALDGATASVVGARGGCGSLTTILPVHAAAVTCWIDISYNMVRCRQHRELRQHLQHQPSRSQQWKRHHWAMDDAVLPRDGRFSRRGEGT